jgi:hypothetical protein
VQLQITGFTPDAVSPLASQTIEALVEIPGQSIFQWAVYADTTLWADQGVLMDSYDSSLGPYFADDDPEHMSATVQLGDGQVGGTMTISDNSAVYGDAFVAPGYDPDLDIVTYGSASISGVRGIAPALALPVINEPSGSPQGTVLASCPGGSGGSATFDATTFPHSRISLDFSEPCHITITGSGTVHLDELAMPPGGTLIFDGDIQVTTGRLEMWSNIALAPNASVSVYADGDVHMPTRVNDGGRPTDFTLYVVGPALSNVVIGGGKFYGAIYAPQRMVHIRGHFFYMPGLTPRTEVFGSIVTGQNAVLGATTQVHQDLSLKTLGSSASSQKVKIRSWRIL